MPRSAGLDRIADRGWRAYADARRRLTASGRSTSALVSLGSPDRHDIAAWNESTAAGHPAYREQHPPAATDAVAVCVSMRPDRIGHVVENVARQRGVDVRLVFVANHAGFAGVDVEAAMSGLPEAIVIRPPEPMSLGAALNTAITATGARFVAKFDDDDWYGANFLVDSLRAHGYAGAAVVGKHAYYAHLTSVDRHYLRFPGHEFSYSSTLAGGTLVIDRELTTGIEFDDVSLGEDRRFLAACHRQGRSTFAADRFGFVQHRGTDNTWQPPDEHFLANCVEVDPEADAHRVER